MYGWWRLGIQLFLFSKCMKWRASSNLWLSFATKMSNGEIDGDYAQNNQRIPQLQTSKQYHLLLCSLNTANIHLGPHISKQQIQEIAIAESNHACILHTVRLRKWLHYCVTRSRFVSGTKNHVSCIMRCGSAYMYSYPMKERSIIDLHWVNNSS
jgi:hypothetical protein